MQKKILIVFPILLLVVTLLFCTRSLIKVPVDILDFQAFYIDMNFEKLALYIDCKNLTHRKTVDYLLLSVVCDADEEKTFQYRILEPEGILPKECHANISDFSVSELPIEDITTVEVFVSQVGFKDGSVWECNKMQKPVAARMDGNRGIGAFPISINEALFYDEAGVIPGYEPIHFQIDWSNISEAECIVNVTYKVTAKTADGTMILSKNGDEAVYVSEFYAEPSEWIQPFSDNKNVEQRIYDLDMTWNFREKEAVIYEVSVCRAVTSSGVVWENEDESDHITVVVCGKKGYAFGDDLWNASVRNLTKRIGEESERYAIDLGMPNVFVKDKQYCVLRYPNIDVRVELSETNEVIPDKVAFIYYSKAQYDNWEEYIQTFLDKMKLLRLCICTSVLTGMPQEEVVHKVSEYNNNDKAYIDFDDLSYDTFEEGINILDEEKATVNCWVFACGKDLYYPPEKLFWVRESPYEIQQNLEVQHRQ